MALSRLFASHKSSKRRPVGITVVCGALGAGKTSLVNVMLRQLIAQNKKVVVVENEFGEISIDDALLSKDTFVRSVHGACACCGNGRRTLCVALAKLALDDDAPDMVLVELSGVSDPGPVAKSIVIEPAIRRLYRLDSVIAVVDSKTFPELPPNAVRLADCVVINKVDLIDRETVRCCEAAVKRLNPTSRVVRATFGEGYKVTSRRRFSMARALELDPTFFRYSFPDKVTDVDSLCLSTTTQYTRSQIDDILQAVKVGPEDGVVRYKCIFAVKDSDQHFVLQGVKDYARDTHLGDKRRWTNGDESRLVFIGHNLNKRTLMHKLRPYVSQPALVCS